MGRWSWGLGDAVGGGEWNKVKQGTKNLRSLEEGELFLKLSFKITLYPVITKHKTIDHYLRLITVVPRLKKGHQWE